MRLLTALLALLVCASPAWATDYYISPSGSDSANGTSTSTPWLTFAKAFGGAGMANSGCGHTLNLMDGVYGDGTSTGKISLTSRLCTAGNELTIKAVNERQARINWSTSTGGDNPFAITSSAYINIVGLHWNGTNVSGVTTSGSGGARIASSNHINVLRSLGRNPNKYAGTSILLILNSQDVLVEQLECYDYHRYCVNGFQSTNVVMRLSYGNGRTGMIAGGYNNDTGVGTANALMAFYPCNNCILESSINEGANNGSYLLHANSTFGNNVLMADNKILGNVCLDCNAGNGIVMMDVQPLISPNHVHYRTLIENNAFVNFNSASPAIRMRDGIDVVLNKNTVLGGGTGVTGFTADDQTNTGVAAANLSWRVSNNIVKGMTGVGFRTEGAIQILTGSNNNWSNGNGTSFSPSAATWGTGNVTTDPGLGDCKVWTPDGSAAKTAGAGANVLYRYDVQGNETTTPLWDPTTGQFPVGATVVGVNDVVGDSAFDVHKRLNVPYSGDTHSCSFPSTYPGATPPEDPQPSNYETSEGTTGTTHAHTFASDGSVDGAFVAVALQANSGTVGSVAAVTGCASEAYALMTGSRAVNPPGRRAVEWWYKISPTTGACTITVTTTGTVDAVLTTSIVLDDVSDIGTVAATGGSSSTPSVTVATVDDQTILSVAAFSTLATGSAGADQTITLSASHSTVTLKKFISEQSGADGGVMDYTLSGGTDWATSAISIEPGTPDPPATPAVLTQVAGQVFSAFYVNGAASALGAVNAANVNIPVGTSFRVCLQVDATDAAAPEAGRKLYFSRNSGAYVPMLDTATTGISFHGATADPNVVLGAVSANLSGVLTNIPGESIHTVSVTPMAAMTQNSSLVNCWTVKFTPDAIENDTYEFREYTDAGVALDAYGATADAKVTVTGTTPDIAAPTNLTKVGTASTSVHLIWTAVSYATLAGYKVYQSTESGVYGSQPIAIITPEIAALLNISPTSWRIQTLVADTYYFVVTAFDLDGNESAASNEVTAVQAGFTARSASAGAAATARDASIGRGLRGDQSP